MIKIVSKIKIGFKMIGQIKILRDYLIIDQLLFRDLIMTMVM